MVPPPPSQAGKFKPRKPAKKVTVSAASTAAGSGGGASGTVPATGQDNARGDGGRGPGRDGRGFGRDGAGRGGRLGRGRGRNRAPVPQGQVFFTGQAKTATSTSRASGGRGGAVGRGGNNTASAAARGGITPGMAGRGIKVEGAVVAPQEEIVGMLDDDPNVVKPESALSAFKGESDYYEDYETGGGAGASNTLTRSTAIFYASDSSGDEDESIARTSRTLQPLVLPFPNPPQRVGIGGTRTMTPDTTVSLSAHRTIKQQDNVGTDTTLLKKLSIEPSPFVDVKDEQGLRWEERGWFLVQLPTRLPKTEQAALQGVSDAVAADSATLNTVTPDFISSNQATVSGAAVDEMTTTRVSLAPLQTDRFDNALATSIPGRLGKIVVYSSGKTMLVLEGQNGKPSVQLNLTEGLTCGFRQLGASFDTEKCELVTLGDINKTIVATPDLTHFA